MTVTDPETTDLGTRLSMAQAAVAPLRERVSQLEQDLNAALERSDYDTASNLQAELGPARQEYGVAEATARVLAEMQQEIENTRQAEQRRIAEQQRREEVHRQVEDMRATEAESMDEMNRHLAAARAGVDAVKQSLQTALSHQGAVGVARQEIQNLLVSIGEAEPARVFGPSEVSAVLEGRNPILRAIYYGQI
ncbi:hypothetical protein GCM10023196_053850 [Actinoallomurus vinaceus]|uniref:Uncharacterized protein n=1 Tax=Actinoallomurus vinaceus TaxID=1080074 RepID=A0ABP8UFL8_9ACTN